jgi:hypothetical protein
MKIPSAILIICSFSLTAIADVSSDDMANGIQYIAGQKIDSPDRYYYSMSADPLDDTLQIFRTPGTWPGGLTYDGTYFWNTDLDARLIYKLDANGQVDTTFAPPPDSYTPSGIEWDGANLWLVDEQLAMIYKLNPANGEVLNSFHIPDTLVGDQNSWGLAWDGEYLWYSRYGERSRIFKIDPANGDTLFAFNPPDHDILGIAWDGAHICGVSISQATIYRINPANGQVVDQYPWAIPYPLGLYYDGSSYWNVSSNIQRGGNQAVYRVDLETGIQEIIPLPDRQVHLKPFPNPFNASTNISYALEQRARVRLDIYNVLGQYIGTLYDGIQEAGNHNLNWNADGLASGVYYINLCAEGKNPVSAKISLLK